MFDHVPGATAPATTSDGRQRRIYHVDMDAFFASVEQRDDPRLRGLAVIVGGDGRRGVVAAASYEARRAGVRSAMPARLARRLCPEAVFVKPRHGHYRAVSASIFAILREWSPQVEGVSIDEAYLDITGRISDAELLADARALKRRIASETGLTASIGIGSNKLIAKLASAYDKPDGLTWVRPGTELEFLDPLPVGQLPGVGPATSARLHDAGILTVGQLRRSPPELLAPLFGSRLQSYLDRAAGIDDREVLPGRVRRSISQESTFEQDLTELEAVETVVRQQAEECSQRLRRQGLFARSVHLKLRSGSFSTLTRSRMLLGYSRSPEVLAETAVGLLRSWAAYQTRISLRLVGVAVSQLASAPSSDELLAGGEERSDAGQG